MEMNSIYEQLCDNFDAWAADASDLVDGSAVCFAGATYHHDDVYDMLFTPDVSDAAAGEILQLICGTLSIYSRRVLADHLLGRKHHEATPEKVAATQSVPPTNVCSERDFGQLDRLKHQKPNATTIALEAMVLFAKNHTGAWLAKKSIEEKKLLFDAALKLAPEHHCLFKARQAAIWEHIIQEQARKRAEVEAKAAKLQAFKEDLAKAVGELGFWSSPDQVMSSLTRLPTIVQKVAALKKQLKFRQVVLQQSAPRKEVFQWSSCSKAFSWEELASHLIELISDAPGTVERAPTECRSQASAVMSSSSTITPKCSSQANAAVPPSSPPTSAPSANFGSCGSLSSRPASPSSNPQSSSPPVKRSHPQPPTDPVIGERLWLFPEMECQSRLDGRVGSNACTLIALQLCDAFLGGRLPMPNAELPFSSQLHITYLQAIRVGNNVHDAVFRGLARNMLPAEAKQLLPAVVAQVSDNGGCVLARDCGVQTALQAMAQTPGRQAAILVSDTGNSYAVFTQSAGCAN